MPQSIDLTPFLAFALGTNSIIKSDIDNLYEKYKFEAYDLAKKSKHYYSRLIIDGSIKREVSCKRALGLLELSFKLNNEELNLEMINIVKKGWKALYNYIDSADYIDMDIIFKKVIKNIPDDDYYINFTTILLMLANSFEKEIKPTEHVNNMLGFMDIYISHLEGDKNRFSYNIVRNNKELLSKARGIKDRFYSLFSSLETASDLVEFNIIDAELSLLCKSIGLIFDSEEMLLTSMTDNIKIFERDIIELAAIYFIHNNNQNKIESAKFILYGLHLRYVIKGYKDIKEFYFKNNAFVNKKVYHPANQIVYHL